MIEYLTNSVFWAGVGIGAALAIGLTFVFAIAFDENPRPTAEQAECPHHHLHVAGVTRYQSGMAPKMLCDDCGLVWEEQTHVHQDKGSFAVLKTRLETRGYAAYRDDDHIGFLKLKFTYEGV